jgi:hypothetical protein
MKIIETAAETEQELVRLREERNLWKANHDNMVKINQLLRERPDLGDRSKLVEELITENLNLKILLSEARGEAIKWQDAWMEEKTLEEMGHTLFPWARRALDELRAIDNG